MAELLLIDFAIYMVLFVGYFSYIYAPKVVCFLRSLNPDDAGKLCLIVVNVVVIGLIAFFCFC